MWLWCTYIKVSRDLESCIFFWKNYCGAPGGPRSAIFATIGLDPLYFGVHMFSDPPTPPIWLETQKCAIFSTFWVSGGKNHPKVEVQSEKNFIGNFPHLFFMAFYICWDYVISFSQHFPMRKFLPSPSFHPLFEIWLKKGNYFFKIILYFIQYFS